MAKSAEELLIYLFDEILPKHGMNLRVKQKELSLEMLRALQENKLALCEAEVGTGKTHAYILALTYPALAVNEASNAPGSHINIHHSPAESIDRGIHTADIRHPFRAPCN